MRKFCCFILAAFFASCGHKAADKNSGTDSVTGERIVTVSIAPFKYFIEAVGGNDFMVNVMVPAGANPHIYEPYPKQITRLRKSEGYVSNGYLGFEITWLDRFYDSNRTMKKLSLSQGIEPLGTHHHKHGDHDEGADPHYWVSPRCAMIMAGNIKDFLNELNPSSADRYEAGYKDLLKKIEEADARASRLFSGFRGRAFMIFHPNLGYLARDYGLEEISVEFEGKEPPPSRMKELIDRARKERIRTIFVQREYDTKNARAIADEIGASVLIIDPLSEDWLKSTNEIIDALYNSFVEAAK